MNRDYRYTLLPLLAAAVALLAHEYLLAFVLATSAYLFLYCIVVIWVEAEVNHGLD